ncbi:MAG TPA: biotin/lipoyl-binding protein, partial [Candidatus Paceibacterota bacterium]|nr:biotin/lipoyl-binding protein [Candidatus Paceibacterota bacterium]
MASSFLKGSAKWLGKAKAYALAHKVISAIAIVAVLGAGWWGVSAAAKGKVETRYVLGTVSRGTIVASVTASGQVAASRSVDIKPDVTGTITYVAVKPGDTVKQGQLLASLDSSDAQKAVRDAQNDLETAQLQLQKLQEPASGLTLVQAQNAVTTAQDSLAKDYTTSETDIVSTFLALPDLMASLEDIVIGTTASRGSQWNIDYYQNSVATIDSKAFSYRD